MPLTSTIDFDVLVSLSSGKRDGNGRRLFDIQCVLNDTSKAFDSNFNLNRDYIPSKYSPRFEILYITSVTESVSKYVMVRSLT